MNRLLMVAFVLVAPLARDGEAQIRHGRDRCAVCDMLIGDQGFAGVARYAGGEEQQFDDLACLFKAILDASGGVTDAWIEDRLDGHLFPLQEAYVVQGSRVRTPMGSGIVAFANGKSAQRYARSVGARVVRLAEVNPSDLVRALSDALKEQITIR